MDRGSSAHRPRRPRLRPLSWSRFQNGAGGWCGRWLSLGTLPGSARNIPVGSVSSSASSGAGVAARFTSSIKCQRRLRSGHSLLGPAGDLLEVQFAVERTIAWLLENRRLGPLRAAGRRSGRVAAAGLCADALANPPHHRWTVTMAAPAIPPLSSQPPRGLHPAAGDPGADPTVPQCLPATTEVVGLVGVQPHRAPSWPADPSPRPANPVHQMHQQPRVVSVGRRDERGQRYPGAVQDQVVLGARLAAIGGIGADQFPPRSARTLVLSRLAAATSGNLRRPPTISRLPRR